MVRTRRGGPQPAPEARLPVRPVDAYPPARTGSPGARTRASLPRAVVSVDADSNAATGTKATGTKATTKEARRDQGGGGARGAPRETRGVGGGRHHRNDSRRRRRRRHRWFAEGRDGTASSRPMPSSPRRRPRARRASGRLRRRGRSRPRRPSASRRVVARHSSGRPFDGPARLEPFATDGHDTPAWVKAATMRHRAVSDSDSDEDDVPSASRFASRASTTEPEAAIPATKGVKDTPAVVRNSRASVAGTVAASVGGSTDGELDALRARLESAASERASKVADAAAPKGTAAEPLVGDDVRSFGSLVRARAAMFGGVR